MYSIFVGHPSHQSARYELRVAGRREAQSSSGVIVGTGTGATGWLASLARQAPATPLPMAESSDLAFFVREPWPSPATGTDLTAGALTPGEGLGLEVVSDGLVVFGDGIESDRLTLPWGATVEIRLSDRALRLVS